MPKSLALALQQTGRRIDVMEMASNDFFRSLRNVTVDELKALRPNTPRFKELVETMIVLRELMG